MYMKGGDVYRKLLCCRYMKGGDVYRKLFQQLLNIASCDALPDLVALRQQFERHFRDTIGRKVGLEEFRKALRKLAVEYFNRCS